ncbi:spore gernimation protein GerPD [Rossellomorea vietnamensis]|uniref:Spore gernimation protein GerPD n=1 Tax=Rossellomorea vietnamensis TaxID=218284 RepID=A0A5D4NQD3_9BACI|nr:spore gernimation protein GerPD [Rossellomorea vietnamensis]TYS15874.1 spore gernimation protein GerPD [Rossellomorea vietnamensis]
MNLQVINRELCVNTLNIEAVASSSLLLIGDANIIQLASTFDTPAESLIIGPFVPLTPKG